MLILAADTSTNAGSVALAESREDGSLRVVVERSWDLRGPGKPRAGAPNHSDRIVPEIDAALAAAGVEWGAIEGLACATGPGSFTGLRVALSALKGIAAARALPLVGVSTLETLAWNAPLCAHPVVPMLDARKSEIYGAAYGFDGADGRLATASEPRVGAPDAFLADVARLAGGAGPITLVGDGVAVYRELVAGALGARARVLDGSAALPHAGNVARLAAAALATATPASAAAVVPTYLRRPEAEWKTLSG